MPVLTKKLKILKEKLNERDPSDFFIENSQLIRPESADKPHPTQPGKTLLEDANQRFQQYLDKRARMGMQDSLDLDDMSEMYKSLKEEYMGKPKPPSENKSRYGR